MTITATDANDASAAQDFTLTVDPSTPTVTSPSTATMAEHTAGSFQVTADGDGPLSYAFSGPLPAGVSSDSTGLLSGTPAYGTAGNSPSTVTVTDANDATTVEFLTLTATSSAPVFASGSSTTFTEHLPGSLQMQALGDGPLVFSSTGPLPAGVTLSAGGLLSGTRPTGRPAATTSRWR